MRQPSIRSVGALLLATVLAAGCQTSGMPSQIASPVEPGMTIQAAEFGEVEIRVRWPQAVQAIPFSANSLVVAAFDGFGRRADQVVLTRVGGQNATFTTSMRLKAGTYTVEARAYRDTNPSIASEPVAFGSAGNVRVKTNIKTNLQMTLAAEIPTVGAMSSSSGGIGSSFTLDTVELFGRPVVAGDVVEVFMGQVTPVGQNGQSRVKATATIEPRRRLDPTTKLSHINDPQEDLVKVVVPQGLKGECKVWLRVDNNEHLVGTFWVVDRMTFTHDPVVRQIDDPTDEYHDAKADLKAYALDTLRNLSYPMLTWTSSNPRVAFVTTDGKVYAYQPGTATITATSGSITAAFTLISTNRQSTASIDVNVPLLGVGTVSVPVAMPEYVGESTGSVTHP